MRKKDEGSETNSLPDLLMNKDELIQKTHKNK